MDKSVGLRGYCCFNCRNIVADHNDIINKEFLVKYILLLFAIYVGLLSKYYLDMQISFSCYVEVK